MFTTIESNGAYTYAKVSKGMFVYSAKKGDPKAVLRVNSKGEEVYEKMDNSVTGKILFLNLKTNDYQGIEYLTLNVGLEGIAGKSIIQMRFPSAYSRGFLNKIDGIDFSKEVTLIVGDFEKNGKRIIYLNIVQNGKKLDSVHTIENPNGLPQMVKVKLRGKEEWDDTDQQEFYRAKIEKYSKLIEDSKSPVTSQPQAKVESSEYDSKDELPFN